MSAFYDLASLVLVPSGYKASKVYAQKPLTTDGQLTFSRASTATRVNASGLIETVASNVPRLDYLGSTCPKLLLEPSRTNVFTKNTEFNHGDWVKRSGMIVTGDYGISPDGTQNADRLQFGTSSDGYIYQARTISPSTAYTISAYAKGTGTIQFNIYDGTGAFTSAIFPLTSQWQRFSFSITSNSTTAAGDMGFYISNDAQVWGAQLEAGAYPTSLILTTTAAVTRLADACNKTGISSLIGQTEGTMFVEVELTHLTDPGVGTNQYLMQLYFDAGARILVFRSLANALNYYFLKGGSAFFSNTSVTANGRYKLAFAYKSGDSAFYINGVQQHTSTAAFTAFASLSEVHIGANFNPTQAEIGDYSYAQALLFKTRLTNAQLAELTTL